MVAADGAAAGEHVCACVSQCSLACSHRVLPASRYAQTTSRASWLALPAWCPTQTCRMIWRCVEGGRSRFGREWV